MTEVMARDQGSVMESVVIQGDLGKLTPEQRSAYYFKVCDSLGLNPLTKPFDYIMLNGKLTLYCRRDAADQLRRIHGINLTITGREKIDDLYIVTARATDRDGRQDESTGVVALAGLKGDVLANALMKAETKAKRRVTLSLVGLGWLDETEVETIPDARVVSEPVVTQPETPRAHWIDDETARKRFWSWTGNTLGMTNTEVHAALGVQTMTAYTGTMADCKAALMAWVNEQVKPEQPDEGTAGM
jgi:hypothetical protein